MPKRYNSITRKLLLKNKKIIKATPSSMTRIGLIICIEDPKEAPSVDYIHIEDTELKKTTIVDIATTTYPIRSNTISATNLNANQVSI
jgi:hypothetical protein